MNTKSILIAVMTVSFAGLATANGKSPGEAQQDERIGRPLTSTLSRATVMAELIRARQNCTLNLHPDYGHPANATPPRAGLSRAEVVGEIDRARANGTLNVHPDHGTTSMPRGADLGVAGKAVGDRRSLNTL